jgi:hypothetical protein
MGNEFNPDDLLKNKGYSINNGDLIEWAITQIFANTLLTSEVLKRQIELEQLIKVGVADHEKAETQLRYIAEQLAAIATERKNDLIAKLFLKNKD